MREVTVVHITPKINFPLIKATGLLFTPDKLPTSDLDVMADRVAKKMRLGPEHRRVGAVWTCLPTWTQTIEWFYGGLQPTRGLSYTPGENGVIAFEVDADRHYAYNFEPLWQKEETEYEEDFDKAARAFWSSATLLSKLIGKPEPWPGDAEVLVRGPIPPWQLRTYYTWDAFKRDPRNKSR